MYASTLYLERDHPDATPAAVEEMTAEYVDGATFNHNNRGLWKGNVHETTTIEVFHESENPADVANLKAALEERFKQDSVPLKTVKIDRFTW